MSEAFPLEFHLILLYFIRISLPTPKIFILFGWGVTDFFFYFKSLDNNMVYTLDIGKFIVGLTFSANWRVAQKFSKSNW